MAEPWFRKRAPDHGHGWNIASGKGAAATLTFVAMAGVVAITPILLLGENWPGLAVSMLLLASWTLTFMQVVRTRAD